MAEYKIIEGQSQPLDIQITATPAQSSAGLTPDLVFYDRNEQPITPPPTIAWLDQANWKVRITGLESLIAVSAPYYFRIKFTDAGNKTSFAPSADASPDILGVVPAYDSTASYQPALPTEKDWVRFLIGDRNMARPNFTDAEIEAVIAQEANKWLAAAVLATQILAKGEGVVRKAVGDLQIQFSESASGAYARHIKYLRERGAEETFSTPSFFKVL